MHPSQPRTQTGTHSYYTMLFKFTGQGRKISVKDTCTFERVPLQVSEQHPLLSQVAMSYTPFHKLVKFLELSFCPHKRRLLQNFQLRELETLVWKKTRGFPGPTFLPYRAGVAAMKEVMKGKGWFMAHLPMYRSAGSTLRVRDQE